MSWTEKPKNNNHRILNNSENTCGKLGNLLAQIPEKINKQKA